MKEWKKSNMQSMVTGLISLLLSQLVCLNIKCVRVSVRAGITVFCAGKFCSGPNNKKYDRLIIFGFKISILLCAWSHKPLSQLYHLHCHRDLRKWKVLSLRTVYNMIMSAVSLRCRYIAVFWQQIQTRWCVKSKMLSYEWVFMLFILYE